MRFRAKTVHADFMIERERSCANQCSELAGGAPSRQIHLKKTILCVQKTKAARDIFARCAVNRRDAESIALDGHRRRETRNLPRAVELRQARTQSAAREESARDACNQDDDESDENDLEETAHAAGML